MDTGNTEISADVIIIGGGFGGCYALHALREAGYTVKLIEAGSDVGGVWHFNSYPGARVDSQVPLYQLNLPSVWRSFGFTERFPGHVELRAYFSHMARTLDLYKDAVFNERVIEASYMRSSPGSDMENAARRWTVRTESGLRASGRYVIFATGTTNKPYIPDFPGLDSFSGTVLHPCRWPSTLDIRGKKVGIIGQGASGLQILQELAREEHGADVTVFVRNPPTALPMRQRVISAAEAEELKGSYDILFDQAKNRDESGYAYNPPPSSPRFTGLGSSFYDATPEERQRFYAELWTRGSYAILTSNYIEHGYVKEANAELYQYWAKTVRARISDAVKRDIMAPLEQFQWIGTKRPNLEMDYYEMIDRPNVRLVSLKEEAVKTFTPSGVVTTLVNNGNETTHDLDIVVMATGYDSVTGSLYEMNVKDKHGARLQDRWAGSIQTYLGMVAPGLPDAFILYGPQAPSGLANGPPFLELQVDWIVRFLARLRAEEQQQKQQGSGATLLSFEVKPEVAKTYVQRNLDAYGQSLAKDTPSWWNGANIPGKPREPLFWTLGLQSWRQETEIALEDWTRFHLAKAG